MPLFFPIRRFIGFCLLAVPVFATASSGTSIAENLTTAERREQQRECCLIIDMLQNYHYAGRQFNELDPKEVIDRFLAALDPHSSVLTRAEVDFLHKRFGRSLKSVYLLKGDVRPAFEIFDLFRERALARLAWVDRRLSQGVDLTSQETLPVTPDEEEKPAADEAEADRLWEAHLKHAVIAAMLEGRESAAAVEHVQKGFRRWNKQLASMDALSVRTKFLDTLIGLFDPHSGYFSAEQAEEFEVDMRGRVAGTGIDVWMDEGICRVASVLPGGPAEEQGELLLGDELKAVAESDGKWVELAGKRLREVTHLLRGPAGSIVRLAFTKAADGKRGEITLVRRMVQLLDGRAYGAVYEVPTDTGEARKIGWIDLPSFYASEDGSTSATSDVRELLEQMKAKRVAAIVIDLRRNPGGSMPEAISLMGLFHPSGAVLLTRGMDDRTEVHNMPSATPVFEGPLIVMTSRASASASEIVAGALRFHRRAVLVGGVSTFGKGTVQNYIDLNKQPARAKASRLPWGTLRMTSQRFYFPDGLSPQCVGAVSDIILPFDEDLEKKVEKQLPHVLPGDTVAKPGVERPAEDKAPVNAALIATLKERMAERAAKLDEFAMEKRREAVWQAEKKRSSWSLNLEARRAEQIADDVAYAQWIDDCRTLLATRAFPRQRVDAETIRQVLNAHTAMVRSQRREKADAKSGWLRGSTFFVDGEGSRVREVRLEWIPFRAFAVKAASFAAAFTAATGQEVTVEKMSNALRAVQVLERHTDTEVLACFSGLLPSDEGDPARLRRGVEAVLHKMTEVEPALLNARWAWDIPLRESLRLAADWAEIQSKNASGAASLPAAPASR